MNTGELNLLTIPKQSRCKDGFNSVTDLIVNVFLEHKEPALVSTLLIEEAFCGGDEKDKVACCFDYEVEPKKFDEYAKKCNPLANGHSMYSMVLIGVHKEENKSKGEMGEVWFLLQNTWKYHYFQVVSAKYMAFCEATISLLYTKVFV
jgi:hypothetical protein